MRNVRAPVIVSIALLAVLPMLGVALASASNTMRARTWIGQLGDHAFHNLDATMAAAHGAVKGSAQNAGVGGIGQPYVKGDHVIDPHLDTLRPETLVYGPRKGGDYDLVAIEYIALKDAWHAAFGKIKPKLFGSRSR